MTTSADRMQQLLQETLRTYQAERNIAEILPSFLAASADECLSDAIRSGIRQNKVRLARLDAVMAAIRQVSERGVDSEEIMRHLCLMVRRINSKHTQPTYETAMYLALTAGPVDITLRFDQSRVSSYDAHVPWQHSNATPA